MPSLRARLLRHAVGVGITLAIIGYLLGQAFLTAHRVYSGGAYNPENERVLWQTPVVMASLGILLTVGLDLLIASFRKPAPVRVPTEEQGIPTV